MNPKPKIRRNSSSIVMVLVKLRAAKVQAWRIATICVSRITRMRSTRSASAPANGLMTTLGMRSAAATRPSQVPEWVSCQVSQACATRWIQ